MIKLDIFINKVESEGIVNIATIKQEIKENKLGRNMDEDEVSPFPEMITSKKGKENIITTQMKQWSILSNIVNYVQYDRHP